MCRRFLSSKGDQASWGSGAAKFSLISGDKNRDVIISMGDLQDPIDGGTLVLYFWPYFAGIFPYAGHTPDIFRPYIWNRYLQFRFLKWPLIIRWMVAKSESPVDRWFIPCIRFQPSKVVQDFATIHSIISKGCSGSWPDHIYHRYFWAEVNTWGCSGEYRYIQEIWGFLWKCNGTYSV